MPTRTYNKFYDGTIKQDDFLTAGASFIDSKNITGLRTGYGATLGPKVNKQLLTNGNAPRTIFGRELSGGNISSMAVGCDNGEIYKLNGTDDTPAYTLTTGWDIVNGALLLSGSNFMYFINKQPGASFTSAAIAQVTLTDFNNGTFTSMNEGFQSFSNIYTPPVLVTGTFIYIGGLNTVYRIDNAGTVAPFVIFNRYITGISRHGTQFMVYSDNGEVSYWDGVSSTVSANIPLKFTPARVKGDSGFDNVITTDGDYYMGSGYNFSDAITKKEYSNRLEDNSQYNTKLNFTPTETTGQAIEYARDKTFMISADTIPGIYAKSKIIPGLPDGFHKLITQDNTNTDFDELFTLKYLSRGHSKLYFGFQSGTNYGVDYIDLESQESTKDGYLVTDVFSGGTAYNKQLELGRIARVYASGDDYIKLYKRINNASSWTEINLDTLTDDNIKASEINTQSDEWVDIQFKIEFHNEAEDENPPLMPEFVYDYNVIGKND